MWIVSSAGKCFLKTSIFWGDYLRWKLWMLTTSKFLRTPPALVLDSLLYSFRTMLFSFVTGSSELCLWSKLRFPIVLDVMDVKLVPWSPRVYQSCLGVLIVITIVWCFRLLEVRGSRPGKNVQLTENEIRGLCLKSREIFLSQPILLELEAPLKICGEFEQLSLASWFGQFILRKATKLLSVGVSMGYLASIEIRS